MGVYKTAYADCRLKRDRVPPAAAAVGISVTGVAEIPREVTRRTELVLEPARGRFLRNLHVDRIGIFGDLAATSQPLS